MTRRSSGRGSQLRERIAQTAARIMVEGAIRDFHLAKRKAAQQLGVTDSGQLPQNQEIEAAMQAYQRLFRAASQPEHLRDLRRSALQAMRFLARFEPRLVGPVLNGTADRHGEVTLHLFSEPAEEVGMFLLEQGIPHELTEKRLRMSAEEQRFFPAYRFTADGQSMELIVFPLSGRRHAPLSPVDGRPMRRADLGKVRALADADEFDT